jgi:hypothetical protein
MPGDDMDVSVHDGLARHDSIVYTDVEVVGPALRQQKFSNPTDQVPNGTSLRSGQLIDALDVPTGYYERVTGRYRIGVGEGKREFGTQDDTTAVNGSERAGFQIGRIQREASRMGDSE